MPPRSRRLFRDLGESERDRDRDRDRERELATASRSPDSGECERGGNGESEIATTSRSRRLFQGIDRDRVLGTASRSPDSGECDRGGDGEKERESAMASSSSARTPDYRNVSFSDERYRYNYSAYDWHMNYPSLDSSSSARTPDYLNLSFWDERYRENDSTYDWYLNYRSLVPLFNLYLCHHHRILIIGCGNSALGEDMVDNGYQDVVNIDISSELIETMQAKYAHKLALKYIKMDVRDMSPFESGSFDVVIDKGILDSFLRGEDDISDATQLLKEVGRVLKDKGAYILIICAAPNVRLDLLRSVELWNIKLHKLEKVATSSTQTNWQLSPPLPLDRDGSLVTEVLDFRLGLFYIFVCIKDESLSAQQATDTEISSSQNDT